MMETLNAMARALRDTAQSASNAVASGVSGPVDLIAMGMRAAGLPVNRPFGGSEWMAERGLTREVPMGIPRIVGETIGMAAPSVIAGKAPQIAAQVLRGQDAARTAGRELGRTAAGRLEDHMVRQGMIQPITVWHGSPHRFDRFDSSKIGTGEGAQAYGHGLYFAQSPEVAKGYQEKLSKNVTVDGAKLQSIPSDGPVAQAHNTVVRAIQDGMTPEQAIAHAQKYWSDAASEMAAYKASNPELASRIDKEVAERMDIVRSASGLRPESFFRDPGNLYKVDLPDSAVARMLDWDKPLSQQAPDVQRAVTNVKDTLTGPFSQDMIGDQLLRHIQSTLRFTGRGSETAESVLRQQGIPGIRYLDGGSRGAGAGSSNFVVFPGEEQNLRILERNGEPVQAVIDALRRSR